MHSWLMTNELCDACRSGFHAPFDRFRQLAVHEDGPTFLKLCGRCGTLWHETLRDAQIVTVEEAERLYPDVSLG